MMNTAKQTGGAPGLATLIAISTSGPDAGGPELAAGYGHAFTLTALVLAAVAVLAWWLPARHDEPSTDRHPSRQGQE